MAGAYRVNTWSTLRGLSKVKAHLTAHDVGFNIPRNGGHDAFAACIDLDDGNYAPHVQSLAPEEGNQRRAEPRRGGSQHRKILHQRPERSAALSV